MHDMPLLKLTSNIYWKVRLRLPLHRFKKENRGLGGLPNNFAKVEPPTKYSKRVGLDRTSIFTGGCWERVDDFFHGGLQFLGKKTKIYNI